MEKIFKSSLNLTRNTKSKILLNLQRDKTKKFLYQARDLGHEYNDPGYYAERANGVCYLLLYTKSGQATLNYKGKKITLNPGSFIFISLADLNVISAPDTSWEIYFMHVMGSDMDAIYQTVSSRIGCFIENFNADVFVDGINKLYDVYSCHEINYYDASDHIFHILMDVLKQASPLNYHAIVNRAITYMHANYNQKLTLDKLCKDLNVSKSFFIRIFNANVGCAPMQYLKEIRIARAKYLLIHSDKQIQEIALITGFETEKNIYYAFKSTLGLSPTEYKENFL